MWNRIKEYLKRLVSDNSGIPSTRLHLAWGCFFLLSYYVGYNTYIHKDMQTEVLWALISGMAAMSGLSVMDKGASIKNGFDSKNN